MDYEYYDESRTRFQLQSGPSVADPEEEKKTINLSEVGACFLLALLCLGFAWYSQGILQFSLFWLASAVLVGPFAPPSATGGVCRVGVGELLPPEKEEDEVSPEIESFSTRNSKQRRKAPSEPVEEPGPKRDQSIGEKKVDHANHHVGKNGNQASVDGGNGEEDAENDGSSGVDDDLYDYDNSAYQKQDMASVEGDENCTNVAKGDAEWTPADVELLKKLMVKYPRGMLKRWEVIAESFDGSHNVESIVKMSKAIGEKKKGTNDAYTDFLAKRKGQVNAIASPLSQRWEMDDSHMEGAKAAEGEQESTQGENGVSKVEQGKKKSEWTEAEDKALLSALKSFPKDSQMRWEKVALAVPTRTKQQCYRRYTQLKDSFRNKLEKS